MGKDFTRIYIISWENVIKTIMRINCIACVTLTKNISRSWFRDIEFGRWNGFRDWCRCFDFWGWGGKVLEN